MKWLATFILCLLPISIAAQQAPPNSPPGTVVLPLVTLCSPLEPDLGLLEKYGEIGFIEGDASIYIPNNEVINGKLKFYMNPDYSANTFTIMFQVGELYCLIMSGQDAIPMTDGDPT